MCLYECTISDFVVVPVQDACLLAMLRLAADCEDIPSETLGTISKLKEASGRHIKRVSIM